MERKKYETCLNVLKEELIPAMGCTEPVAVAYAAALARDTLGAMPEHTEVAVSGNILKNVKSVVVPNTGGLRGVAVAVAAGIVAGDASKELEVLSAITAEEIGRIAPYMQSEPIAVKESDSGCVFDIGVRVFYLRGGSYKEIAHTIVNALAIESGVICDGAKSSCAAKVASAVEAGLVGMEMSRRGSEFIGGDGIVEKGVENTIRAVGDLARNGMRETDEEIIRLMIRQLA